MKSDRIDLIRQQLPAVSSCIYLNTGTNGPLCRATADIMTQIQEKEYLEGRYLPFISELNQDMDTTRNIIGDLIGADRDEVALTHSATEGMNIVLWGMNWQSGDEIITTNREHVAALAPIALVKGRFGLNVKYLEVEFGDDYDEDRFVERFEQSISRRSRLLVVSHVSFSTGLTFPLKRLAEICHRHGMYILVDGAQGAGATQLDVGNSGIDFYAIAGRKWLLGPEGIGALYVAKSRISEIAPTFISPSSVRHRHDLDISSPYIIPAPFAARFQTATAANRSILLGWQKALIFLRDEVGTEWMLDRIAELVAYLRGKLASIPEVTIVTPAGNEAAFIHIQVEGWKPADICSILNERKYMIRPVPEQHLPAPVRISVGFYNTRSELDGLAENIADIANS
ncbi:MAG: aminotransferase class V-fold PLP-dependent enzyme [Spirochaetales bacterium]|jgi:L-cysteine/cystine lyase|nr:aminotransferase class V-fold PLP-dependent enzyme [Spirochaetales bacterium]